MSNSQGIRTCEIELHPFTHLLDPACLERRHQLRKTVFDSSSVLTKRAANGDTRKSRTLRSTASIELIADGLMKVTMFDSIYCLLYDLISTASYGALVERQK